MFSENDYINERYCLIKKIGQGGFSVVWLAEDTYTDTKVAVKIFAPDKGLDKNGLAQFKKEFRRTRGLKHPNLLVASHFDILSNSSSPFLIMPYCPNGSLADRIHSGNALSEQEMAGLFIQVGNGLSELHKNKIIHQDIKPDNVLIDAKNRYQLTDFGISRQMRSTLQKATANQSYMTVAYSPPERYSANPVDTPASDIFSFGVMCFELSTGYVPWDGAGGMVLNSGAAVPNLPEHYPNRLNKILKACMHKRYENRPAASKLASMGEEFFNEGAWPALDEDSTSTTPDITKEPEAETKDKTEGRQTEKIHHINRKSSSTVKIDGSHARQQPEEHQKSADRKGDKKNKRNNRYKKTGSIFTFLVILLVLAGASFIGYQFNIISFNDASGESFLADSLLLEARTAFKNGNIISPERKNAALLIENILQVEPDYDKALTLRDSLLTHFVEAGDRELKGENYSAAIRLYQNGLTIKPDDARLKDRISQAQQLINDENVAQQQELKDRAKNLLKQGINLYYWDDKKEKEVTELYRQAADLGNAIAKAELGKQYLLGNGISKNKARAVSEIKASVNELRQLAEEGEAHAQYMLGWIYSRDESLPEFHRPSNAIQWYRRAAEQGYALAQNNLGVSYDNGEGVPEDETEATRWFRRAAEQGYATAQKNLGLSYEYGKGVSVDEKEAVRWYRKAAEQGFTSAQYELGQALLYGKGVPENKKEAVRWYRKAAEQGYARAQNTLGIRYENGEGVTQDYNQAMYWYKKAADQNYSWAYKNIGDLFYYKNSGFSQSNKKAYDWYLKAAEQENYAGQEQIGEMYDFGFYVPLDWQKAIDWYKKAAENGSSAAQRKLGEFYYFGVGGVTKNETLAKDWFRKAAENGNNKADIYLKVLRDIELMQNRTSVSKTNAYGDNLEVTYSFEEPIIMRALGNSWVEDVTFHLENASRLQVWPSMTAVQKDPDDEIDVTNFSSSQVYFDDGSKKVSISSTRVARAIGYMYVVSVFDTENIIIKLPLALCWQPE